MPGFSNGTVYANNVDFSGNAHVQPEVTANGQLMIGSATAPNIRIGTLTSTDGSCTITNGAGTIDVATIPNYWQGYYQNTAVGNHAGDVASSTTSGQNTIVGDTSGHVITTGSYNSIYGANSATALADGGSNCIYGARSAAALTSGSNNCFYGNASGASTTTNTNNTYIGYNAGTSSTSGDNTFVGSNCGSGQAVSGPSTFVGAYSGQNATGQNCTFMGWLSGRNSTGDKNTYIGYSSGSSLTSSSGSFNTAVGTRAMESSSGGNNNVAIGQATLSQTNFSGSYNTCVGDSSATSLVSGSYNAILGRSSGSALASSESSNILISSSGVVGDNNTIRIGTQGTGTGQQSTAYMAGIVGNSVANTELVTINSSTGQLGVTGIPSNITSWHASSGATLAKNNGYIVSGGSGPFTFILPTTAAVGDTMSILDQDGTGFVISQNAGQSIQLGYYNTNFPQKTTTGTSGSVTSAGASGDYLMLVCTVADTLWVATSIIGQSYTVV